MELPPFRMYHYAPPTTKQLVPSVQNHPVQKRTSLYARHLGGRMWVLQEV